MYCTYAGNTLMLKKGNHRFAVDLCTYYREEDQLSEHMFITGLTGPGGRKTFMAGAAPSGCGKTTTAMVGSDFIGDDLAQIWIEDDGTMRAVNPEIGIFGIVKDVNREGDPYLMKCLRGYKPVEVIWSNVLVDDDLVPHWTSIAEVLVSESCYLWLILDTPSNDCLVRIGLEGTDESPVDVSDSIFSIISDTPSCGEIWSTAMYSGTGKFTSVTYDGSKFAAVGKGGVIMTSYNGKKWSVQSSGVTNDLNGIIYGDNKFAAVGAGGLILTSSDGINWIDQYPGADNELRGIAYGNNMFAGVGVGGLILTSLDGIAWQVQSPGIAVDFRGITHGNNKFVAVGDRGTIMTSIDGINWSKRSSWTTNTLYGITFGDNKFLAVGESGVILSSSDGVNWNSRTSSVSMNLLNVGQSNSTFVIVGEYGEILTSPDGINWTSRYSGVRNNLTGIACTESLFVVVGVETILYSLCE